MLWTVLFSNHLCDLGQ